MLFHFRPFLSVKWLKKSCHVFLSLKNVKIFFQGLGWAGRRSGGPAGRPRVGLGSAARRWPDRTPLCFRTLVFKLLLGNGQFFHSTLVKKGEWMFILTFPFFPLLSVPKKLKNMLKLFSLCEKNLFFYFSYLVQYLNANIGDNQIICMKLPLLFCVVCSEWQLAPQWIAPRRPSFFVFLLSLHIFSVEKLLNLKLSHCLPLGCETFPFSPTLSAFLKVDNVIRSHCNSFLKVDASHSESFFKYFASLF